MSALARTLTLEPPYYAVIFTSLRTVEDETGYAAMASRMLSLAANQPGYLGVDSAREVIGITVSYWTDLESIRRWRADFEHREAQRTGRDRWYSEYIVRIARVEREYAFGGES